jgi:hypothetical protein
LNGIHMLHRRRSSHHIGIHGQHGDFSIEDLSGIGRPKGIAIDIRTSGDDGISLQSFEPNVMVAAGNGVKIRRGLAISTIGEGTLGLLDEKVKIGGSSGLLEFIALKEVSTLSFGGTLAVEGFGDLLSGSDECEGVDGLAPVDDAMGVFDVSTRVTEAFEVNVIGVPRQFNGSELVVVLAREFVASTIVAAEVARFVAVGARTDSSKFDDNGGTVAC